MRFKKYQVLTLGAFAVISITIIGVILSGVVVNAIANSENSPYRVSLRNYPVTPTPFQPNAFASILEDGTIELLPQAVHTPTPVPTFPVSDLPANQMNILLLGVDDYEANGFRTDVIILLSINPKHQTASMVSFPRDLYVNIPGYWQNRINTAWELGGFSLLQDTFESNFGIRPDHYMMVNFNGFEAVIDSIGGIDIEVTQPLSDACYTSPTGWCSLEPGMMHMDSDMALWYARSRKTTSDFDRNRRAQDVIQAALKKALKLEMIFKVPELYRYYREYIDTNIQLNEILPLLPMAPAMTNFDNIHRYAVTPEMAYDWITAEGAMVLMPNYDAIKAMLAEALYLNN